MKIAAFIPARLASTRLPNKLILPLGEHSVIATTYLQVLQTKLFSEVVCITDNSGTDFMRWIDALKSDNILALINKGEMYARLFMKYRGYKPIAETTQCGTKLKLATAARVSVGTIPFDADATEDTDANDANDF